MHVFKRRFLVSFLAILLSLVIVSCGKETTETTTEVTPNDSIVPALTNPDGVYVSTDDYSITYQELYNEVKINDGLNQILNLVDTDLLSTYISAVTPEEIAARTIELTYGTDDQEEIDNMDADLKTTLEKSFADSLYLMGYADGIDEYVRLVLARENYTIDQMLDDTNSEKSWYAGPERIASYYAMSHHDDLNAIKIKFMSETDAKSVLKAFNLVSKNGELKLYTGTVPLDQVPSSQLNETNTRSLTDAEILEQFIIMYNYVYGEFRDEVSTDATLEQLLANEDLVVDYETLSEANTSLSTFMYDSLGTYVNYTTDVDSLSYYTYEPVKYYSNTDTSYYMILNLDKTEKADVENYEGNEAGLVALIGQETYDEIQQTIIDTNISTSTFISARVAELRSEHDFAIYDYYIGIDYSNIDATFEIDEVGHATNICSYDDKAITVDDLLTEALNNNAPLYTLYAIQTKAVVAAHYEDVYCVSDDPCEYDVEKNTSEKMEEHRASYASLEEQFASSYYASYYTFDEYIYLAYGAKTDYDMLYDYYVKSTLQPFLIYDQIKTNDYDILHMLQDLAQPFYDNYFSLDVNHVLIYIDRDEDGAPDDYEKFYEALENTAAYDQKLSDFEAAIRTYLDDSTNTMTSLVSAYKKAKRNDAVWGEFKVYGFNLLTEDLGENTYATSVDAFEEPFVDALISMYQDYNTPTNENEDNMLGSSLVESSFGMHLIQVAKGEDFDKPSAKFTVIDSESDYIEALENAGDEVTFEQLKVYADYRFTVIAYGNGNLETIYGLTTPQIPSSLLEALSTYYEDLYNGLYVVGYLNNIIIDQLDSGTYNNEGSYCSITEAQFKNRLDEISDIYLYQIFQELDHRTAE